MILFWTTLKKIWDRLKNSRIFWTSVALVIAFFIGYFVGHEPAKVITKVEEHVVEDLVSKQKLQESLKTQEHLREQLSSAEKAISEMKVRTVEKVHVVYLKDGTTVVDKEKTTDLENKTEETKNTETKHEETKTSVSEKQEEVDTKSHMDTKTTTVAASKDRFFLGIGASVGLSGISRPGLEFKYRLLDLGKISVWTGVEAFTGPPSNLISGTEFRGAVGISF